MEQSATKDKKLLFAAWSCSNKNYFAYQTWFKPLSDLFQNIVMFDPQENLYKYGKEKMNQMFLDLISQEKPDFVYLWLIYDEFSLDTLIKIKQISPKTKLINFFGDDDTLFDNFSRYYALFIDYPLASHKLYFSNYKKEGIKNVFFSCGVNTNDFKYIKSKKKYDVTFIGTPKRDRVDLIKFLIENNVNVCIFGAGWDAYPELKENYFGKLSKEEMVKVINESKINLSFTKNYMDIPSFKARVFEICACKSFLLSEYFIGYLDFLKNKEEIIMFKDKKDLLEKVKFFLKNEKERELVASKAYQKVIKNHSQTNEFKNIFWEIISLEDRIKHKELPKITLDVVSLSKKHLLYPKNQLTRIIKNHKYIAFNQKKATFSKYKKYFQIYSIQKSGKPISCCDYNFTANYLGELASFQSKFTFNTMPDIFPSQLNPSQLLVKSDYFLDNLDLFRNLYSGTNKNFDLINEKSTVFVSIPLVNIRKFININYEPFEKAFIHKFDNKLRELKNKDKLFSNLYIYYLIIHSAIFNPVIAKYLIKRFSSKKKVIGAYIKGE